MLAISIAGSSWAHQARVGFKMLALAVISIILFFVTSWIALMAILLGVIILYLLISREVLLIGLSLMRPLLWVVCLILAFHVFRGEFIARIVVCWPLIILVALANFVTLTSRLTDMIELFLWLLSPLKRIGIQVGPIGLALGMVMRFTPVLIKRAGQLSESWRARGLKQTNWRIILPLFITVVDDADRVAEALRARGGIGK